MATFPSPSDFLSSLRDQESLTIPQGRTSSEYDRLHREELARHGLESFDASTWLDDRFREQLTDLSTLLSPEWQDIISARVAVGCLESPELNAFIARAPSQEMYAILISRGFMSLVNNFVKLVTAAQTPDSVIFFEGTSRPNHSPAVYIAAGTRLLSTYSQTGSFSSYELKFDPSSNARVLVSGRLVLMYRFVLAHELAHLVNGDLRDNNNFSVSARLGGSTVFTPPPDHVMEFAADRLAFELCLKLFARNGPNTPSGIVLHGSAVALFDLLREIDNRGSTTHPPPSSRMLAIVDSFYGSEAKELYRRGFDDRDAMVAFQPRYGIQTVQQLLTALAAA